MSNASSDLERKIELLHLLQDCMANSVTVSEVAHIALQEFKAEIGKDGADRLFRELDQVLADTGELTIEEATKLVKAAQ